MPKTVEKTVSSFVEKVKIEKMIEKYGIQTQTPVLSFPDHLNLFLTNDNDALSSPHFGQPVEEEKKEELFKRYPVEPHNIALARFNKKLDDWQEENYGNGYEKPKISPYPWEK
jgi:hypothetical protein